MALMLIAVVAALAFLPSRVVVSPQQRRGWTIFAAAYVLIVLVAALFAYADSSGVWFSQNQVLFLLLVMGAPFIGLAGLVLFALRATRLTGPARNLIAVTIASLAAMYALANSGLFAS